MDARGASRSRSVRPISAASATSVRCAPRPGWRRKAGTPDAPASARTALGRDPRPDAGERRARSRASGARTAGRRGIAAGGAEDVLRRTSLDAGGRGLARSTEGPPRGAEGPPRQRPRTGPRRLPAQDRPPQERPHGARWRLVCSRAPQGPADARNRGRDGSSDRPRLPVAQVDGVRNQQGALGAPAAPHPLCVRRRGRAVRDRRHRQRRHHPGSPFHGLGPVVQGKGLRRLRREAGEALRGPGPRGAEGPDRRGRQDAVLRPQPGAGRGSGAAGRGGRPGGMARAGAGRHGPWVPGPCLPR